MAMRWKSSVPKAQVPPAAWESFAITGKARAAISAPPARRSGISMPVLAKKFLNARSRRPSSRFDLEDIESAVPRLGFKHIDDLYAGIGRGEFEISEVFRALNGGVDPAAPGAKKKGVGGRLLSLSNLSKAIRLPGSMGKREPDAAIPVRGLNRDLPIQMAPGEGAVPGDRIVGILTPGSGITIYPIHSKALKEFDDQSERWVDLAWDVGDDSSQRFATRISVMVLNEVGALAQVALVISENEGNIANLSMVTRAADFYEMHIELEVADAKHLSQIMSALKARSIVGRVSRITG